ncbi:MAG TPA: hypothetical protein VMZ51_08235 [Acidimicrobiales bacterium]|nr:hypothetical protein [Acidimicrobiales bacterium]
MSRMGIADIIGTYDSAHSKARSDPSEANLLLLYALDALRADLLAALAGYPVPNPVGLDLSEITSAIRSIKVSAPNLDISELTAAVKAMNGPGHTADLSELTQAIKALKIPPPGIGTKELTQAIKAIKIPAPGLDLSELTQAIKAIKIPEASPNVDIGLMLASLSDASRAQINALDTLRLDLLDALATQRSPEAVNGVDFKELTTVIKGLTVPEVTPAPGGSDIALMLSGLSDASLAQLEAMKKMSNRLSGGRGGGGPSVVGISGATNNRLVVNADGSINTTASVTLGEIEIKNDSGNPVPVSGPLTDTQLRASAFAVKDDYQSGEVLADQTGAGAVLTFTFASPVQLLLITATGSGTQVARCDPFGGTPAATTGIRCDDGVPAYLPITATVVKVFAPASMAVAVSGFRRA